MPELSAEELRQISEDLLDLAQRIKDIAHPDDDRPLHPRKRTPGQRLALARNRVGLSQAALAQRASVSVNTIIKFETGQTTPRTSTLMKLADVLDISWEQLADEDDHDRDPDKA